MLDKEGKRWTVNGMDESLTNEITEVSAKKIIMILQMKKDLIQNSLPGKDGSSIDIAACARKDVPGVVAIYYTSPEFTEVIPYDTKSF